jgi:hypothetical protein
MSPVAPTINAFRLVIPSILNIKHDDLWALLVLDQYAQRMSQSRTTVCNFLIVESIAFNRAEIGAVYQFLTIITLPNLSSRIHVPFLQPFQEK